MPWIANVGQAAAERWESDGHTVCISITEPKVPARLPKFLDLLRLEFQDFSPFRYVDGGDVLAERKCPEHAVLFTPTMAAQIARFARKHRDKNILVHCAAGISRSGGVVEALLEAFPEYEDRGWPRYPNPLVKTTLKRGLGLVPIGAEANS